MSEWISVDDRLPDEGALVVAAKYYKSAVPDACICKFRYGEFELDADGLEASNYDGGAQIIMAFTPTHWLQLPDL